MAHVSDYKKKKVAQIISLIDEYPIVGSINMENLPAPQLQKMRSDLRGTVALTMTKRRLIKIALDEADKKKKGVAKLKDHLEGMPALIFTKDNPFRLAKKLDSSKSKAPAKAGQTAPADIEVKAGPTSFAPGPIIGELAQFGIKSGVEGGKVAIKQDSVVARKGDKIDGKLAEILTRLGIEPMEVGLNLSAIYEEGVIYTSDVLKIDDAKFEADLKRAASWAFNLAFDISYPSKDTVELLLAKAHFDARALGLNANIIDTGIIDALIGRAELSMLSLKSAAKIEVPEKKARVSGADTGQKEDKPEDKPAGSQPGQKAEKDGEKAAKKSEASSQSKERAVQDDASEKNAVAAAKTGASANTLSTDDKVADLVKKAKEQSQKQSVQAILDESAGNGTSKKGPENVEQAEPTKDIQSPDHDDAAKHLKELQEKGTLRK